MTTKTCLKYFLLYVHQSCAFLNNVTAVTTIHYYQLLKIYDVIFKGNTLKKKLKCCYRIAQKAQESRLCHCDVIYCKYCGAG